MASTKQDPLTAIQALQLAERVLEDNLRLHAAGHCLPTELESAKRRVEDAGGIITYIVETQAALRAARLALTKKNL